MSMWDDPSSALRCFSLEQLPATSSISVTSTAGNVEGDRLGEQPQCDRRVTRMATRNGKSFLTDHTADWGYDERGEHVLHVVRTAVYNRKRPPHEHARASFERPLTTASVLTEHTTH